MTPPNPTVRRRPIKTWQESNAFVAEQLQLKEIEFQKDPKNANKNFLIRDPHGNEVLSLEAAQWFGENPEQRIILPLAEGLSVKNIILKGRSEQHHLERRPKKGPLRYRQPICNLQGVNLHDLNLVNFDARGTLLAGANLERASFNASQLNGVDLRGANLRHARFDDANLRGANFEGVKLVEQVQAVSGALSHIAVVDLHKAKEPSQNTIQLFCQQVVDMLERGKAQPTVPGYQELQTLANALQMSTSSKFNGFKQALVKVQAARVERVPMGVPMSVPAPPPRDSRSSSPPPSSSNPGHTK